MKKIVLSLAGVMAAVAFAPEASALPVFARQTGMACTACHFQHFPLLNGFGRAFKSAGFTMMGAQGKVEGEELSIPDRLNMALFATTVYQREKAGDTKGVVNVPGTANKWMTPGTGGELSVFVGGRIAEFSGFLAELGMGNGTTAAPKPVVTAAKMALLFPVGDARVGLVVHSSQGQGVAYSFETLNTGAANTHKLMGNPGPTNQHVMATSAAQYFQTNTAATGISVIANNSMGFINVGKYARAGNNLVGGASGLPLTYARIAGTMDVAGWDAGFGLQNFSGSANAGVPGAAKATIIDGQMQGEIAGMTAGLYASYGWAPATSATALAQDINFFNAGANKAKSFNIAGELAVIPHTTLQLAVRRANNGDLVGYEKDNAIMVGVTYELAQNIGLSLHQTTNSGSAWAVGGQGTANTTANVATAAARTAAGVTPMGKTATTLLLEAAF